MLGRGRSAMRLLEGQALRDTSTKSSRIQPLQFILQPLHMLILITAHHSLVLIMPGYCPGFPIFLGFLKKSSVLFQVL